MYDKKIIYYKGIILVIIFSLAQIVTWAKTKVRSRDRSISKV